MAENEQMHPGDQKPDISFGGGTAPGGSPETAAGADAPGSGRQQSPAGQGYERPAQSETARQGGAPESFAYHGQGFDRPAQGETPRPANIPNGNNAYHGQGFDRPAQGETPRPANVPNGNNAYHGQGFERPAQGETPRPANIPNGNNAYRGQGFERPAQGETPRPANIPNGNNAYRGQGFDRPAQGETPRPANVPNSNNAYHGQGFDRPAQGETFRPANYPNGDNGARPVINGNMPRRPENDLPDEGERRSGKKDRKSRKKVKPQGSKRSRAPKEEPRRTDSYISGTAGAAAAAAEPIAMKKKFSKKQALQVTGLILMLILILGLAVFLVFDHYYKLFKHSADDVSNSAPMTYSDVDFSRADTFEKAKEDEKLKELTARADKITSDEVMNILLIGEDLRDTTEERSVGNTDVMMLISVNKKDNTITLTSLMRDCYVGFEDENGWWYSDRINSAYWYGGMKLTKNVIEDYMKVHIDRYVLVNFKVFIDIVDALGGIDMYVSDLEANGDPDAPRSDKEHRGMQNPLDEQNKYLGNKVKTDYIKKGGNLHLNGNQALAYARLRYVGDADFERTQRQRRVINEMIKESRRMSLVQMDQLANKVFPQVTTDVTMGELAGLLLEMLNYRNYKVQEMRVPADGTFTNEFIDGKAVLSVDFEQNVEIFRETAYGTVEFKEKEKSEDGKALE